MRTAVRKIEKELKVDEYISTVEQDQSSVRKLAIIYLILKYSSETEIHRLRGASENEMFIHEAGHKEAVYNAQGKLVEDGINDGSYNFYHPFNEPLLHYSFDILPWTLWGQSGTDPTTMEERLDAYVQCLQGGIMNALYRKEEIPDLQGRTFSITGQPLALTVFMKAIEFGEAEKLFKFFEQDTMPSNEEVFSVLDGLRKGLPKVLADMRNESPVY